MARLNFDVASRVRFVLGRARRIDVGSVVRRARLAASQHDRFAPAVLADMLWSAAFRDTAFNDYFELDFAMLTREERRTFMTSPLSNHIATKYDRPDKRDLFLDKIAFNRAFGPYLGREWIDLREVGPEGLEDFGRRHELIIGKFPTGQAGNGVERYVTADVEDWRAFHDRLVAKGQILVEENIRQHPALAEVCPGTVNTTRVNAFFDGERTHILSWAQKFGRGEVSDQPISGGFYTMLDDNGRSYGDGHTGKNTNRFPTHPDSGASIAQFQLPMVEELRALVAKVGRVVPEVPYVGWDFVIGENGPLVVEGNWLPGIYEHKPSVTGIRTGTRPRFEAVIGR
ncbi:sugar-transfer associated ATP-grasp domain-containing protein [Microbacterium sp. Marseille-Q6965]|uniref:sugar-transfer associated ATP-grasp domain-containing protein n=1 Tax=Microbacterium sp. Marseille-Q6965 TaxID=2965072 RepID=UPI0021B74C2C|nr:sugar-transfer associated ATP-grasp domain-containing protein [Microbacterium sp. Marseille-Q6965]